MLTEPRGVPDGQPFHRDYLHITTIRAISPTALRTIGIMTANNCNTDLSELLWSHSTLNLIACGCASRYFFPCSMLCHTTSTRYFPRRQGARSLHRQWQRLVHTSRCLALQLPPKKAPRTLREHEDLVAPWAIYKKKQKKTGFVAVIWQWYWMFVFTSVECAETPSLGHISGIFHRKCSEPNRQRTIESI